MISPFEEGLLNEILEWRDVDEVIEYLLREYAKKGPENAQYLLRRIGDLAGIMLEQTQKKVNSYSEAAHWLVAQREMEPDKTGMFFATMLPVCKALFPNGNADGHCEAEKRYFQQFLDAFSDKKQFSWKRDRIWADLHNYTDYLQLVERQMKGER